MQLKGWEQVLLHLSDYDGELFREGTLPYALTQHGIRLATGMSETQVGDILEGLESKRMVSSENHRVKGTRCVIRCYFIENRGRDEMKRICNRMECIGRRQPQRPEVDEGDLWTSGDLTKVSETLKMLCRMGNNEGWMGVATKIPNDTAIRTEGYE